MLYQLAHFKTKMIEFYIGYQIDSFQDHFTYLYYAVANGSFQDQADLILPLDTKLTHFKTISPTYSML